MASPLHTPDITDKPWGREICFARHQAYAGKLIEIRQGCRISLQLHRVKSEALYLLSGRIKLTYCSPAECTDPQVDIRPEHEHVWLPGKALNVPAGVIHRFEALEASVLLEVSTPELTDVVRLSDDYSRPAHD